MLPSRREPDTGGGGAFKDEVSHPAGSDAILLWCATASGTRAFAALLESVTGRPETVRSAVASTTTTSTCPNNDDRRSHARGTEPPVHRRLYGGITHTDFASTDPAATKAWCAEVLGWNFAPPIAGSAGEYHLFAYSESGGGGIREVSAGEAPGSTPVVHVRDTQAAFDAAIARGAEEIRPPTRVMEGVCTALVRAPGGIYIGFSGPT